jgi:hypothetical protein
MTQAQLERAVARATGESLRNVRRRGFGIEGNVRDRNENQRAPQIVDWDALDRERHSRQGLLI